MQVVTYETKQNSKLSYANGFNNFAFFPSFEKYFLGGMKIIIFLRQIPQALQLKRAYPSSLKWYLRYLRIWPPIYRSRTDQTFVSMTSPIIYSKYHIVSLIFIIKKGKQLLYALLLLTLIPAPLLTHKCQHLAPNKRKTSWKNLDCPFARIFFQWDFLYWLLNTKYETDMSFHSHRTFPI